MARGRSFHTLDKDLVSVTNAEAAQRQALRPVLRLGLVMFLAVVALILAAGLGLGGAGEAPWLAAIIVACWVGVAIGSNDVANSLGPAVGSGAIGLVPGLLLVALAEITGALLAGGAVTDRLSSGIVDLGTEAAGGHPELIMLSALMGAAIWISTATRTALPVSTSHSIVGGIAGAGLAALGSQAVDWVSLSLIATTWILTPLVAGALAGVLVILLKLKVLDAPDRAAGAWLWLPLLVGLMTGLFAAYLVALARPEGGGSALAVASALVAALAGWLGMRRTIAAEALRARERPSSKRLFRPALLVAATIMGFAHGANDVGNVAGPLSVILLPGAAGHASLPGPAILLLAGVTIALGTLIFGRRLVTMVGSGITKLNAGRAFCVSLATAAVVLTASGLGLPVSTTHVAIGGIFGVGFAREWLDRRRNKARARLPAAETRRRMLIRRSHVATITVAWVVTVPITGLLGGLICLLLLRLAG